MHEMCKISINNDSQVKLKCKKIKCLYDPWRPLPSETHQRSVHNARGLQPSPHEFAKKSSTVSKSHPLPPTPASISKKSKLRAERAAPVMCILC